MATAQQVATSVDKTRKKLEADEVKEAAVLKKLISLDVSHWFPTLVCALNPNFNISSLRLIAPSRRRP